MVDIVSCFGNTLMRGLLGLWLREGDGGGKKKKNDERWKTSESVFT